MARVLLLLALDHEVQSVNPKATVEIQVFFYIGFNHGEHPLIRQAVTIHLTTVSLLCLLGKRSESLQTCFKARPAEKATV